MNKTASIVCLGKWNTKVFTPILVSNNIFVIPKGGPIDILFDNKTTLVSYKSNDIIFAPTDALIEFRSDKFDPVTLEKMNGYFCNLLQLFSNTPISVYGFNLKITLTENELQNNAIIDYYNKSIIDGFSTSSLNLTKKVNNCLHGIVVQKNEQSYTITFNHQYEYSQTNKPEQNIFKNIEEEMNLLLKK